jgi:hypothetical protein
LPAHVPLHWKHGSHQLMDGDRVLLTFRVFQYSVIDGKDELVDKHESCYKALVQTIQSKGDKEISNSLNMEAMESHKNICTGLLVSILTEPGCIKYYSYMGFLLIQSLG